MAGLLLSSLADLGGESLMSAIEKYLDELNSALETTNRRKRGILNEVRDHLLDSTAQKISLGAPTSLAEDEAINAFGSADLIARGLNACEGARAAKEAPLIALSTGATVFIAFLAAAWSQPINTANASIFQEITFFIGVISAQFALASGLCGASRALSLWRSLESSGKDRTFIKQVIRISIISLDVSVLVVTFNLIFDSIHEKNSNKVALVSSAVIMIALSIAGFIKISKLHINSPHEIHEGSYSQSPKIWTLGEWVISAIKKHPTIPLLCVTIVCGLSAMNKAETNTLQQALPWGAAEVAAIVLGFFLLGPTLGLRESNKDQAVLN